MVGAAARRGGQAGA